MSRQTGTRLVLLFLSAVCLLSLGLPFVYRTGSDVWLQKRGTLRPVQADALSAQGQAVPLAYALYRNRFAPATALETSADEQQVQQELQEKLAALSAAGALPEPVTKRAGWIMAQQPADTTRKQENGFASATWLVLPEEEQTAYAVTACWQEKTDYVVSCTVGGRRARLVTGWAAGACLPLAGRPIHTGSKVAGGKAVELFGGRNLTVSHSL